MKFGSTYVGPIPYTAAKAAIKYDTSYMARDVILGIAREFGSVPRTHEEISLDYLAILKLVKKYDKWTRVRRSLWNEVLVLLRETQAYKDNCVEFAYQYDSLYPQFSSIKNLPGLVAHKGIVQNVPDTCRVHPLIDMVEIDVQMDSFNRVIVEHDIFNSLGVPRVNAKVVMNDLLLEDVVKRWGSAPLVIDVKGATCSTQIIDKIAVLTNGLDARLITFNVPFLKRIQATQKFKNYGLITENFDPEHVVNLLNETGSNMLAIHWNVCTNEYVKYLRENAKSCLNIMVYTVNSFAGMQVAARCNVDYIIHDVRGNVFAKI